jgi:hypothetical protein
MAVGRSVEIWSSFQQHLALTVGAQRRPNSGSRTCGTASEARSGTTATLTEAPPLDTDTIV